MSKNLRHGTMAAVAVVSGLSLGAVAASATATYAVAEDTSTDTAATTTAIKTVLSPGNLIYNGTNQTFGVLTVVDEKGMTVKPTAYTVAYSDAAENSTTTYADGPKNAGSYKVTVTANPNSDEGKKYTGSASATFKIIPKPATIEFQSTSFFAGAVVDPDDLERTVTGTIENEGLSYDVKIKDGANDVTAIMLNNVGKYTITAELDEDDNVNKNYNVNVINGTLDVLDPNKPFIDASSKTPHYDDILWMCHNKMAVGWTTPAGHEYRPESVITRADMAAFLYRIAGQPTFLISDPLNADAKRLFNDVDESTPHYKEIIWCAKNEIAKGWKTGEKDKYGTDICEFRPNDPVIRQDMAAFMFRTATRIKGASPNGGTAGAFSDVTKQTPHYEPIEWLAGHNISTGWEVEGEDLPVFHGELPVIRQDMAAFLHRLNDEVMKTVPVPVEQPEQASDAESPSE